MVRRTEMGRIGERLLVLVVRVMVWLTGVRQRVADGTGQSMVEYAIILALVAIVAMVAIQAFGQGVQTVFQHLLSKIQGIGS